MTKLSPTSVGNFYMSQGNLRATVAASGSLLVPTGSVYRFGSDASPGQKPP
jgi:hypothetical protein